MHRTKGTVFKVGFFVLTFVLTATFVAVDRTVIPKENLTKNVLQNHHLISANLDPENKKWLEEAIQNSIPGRLVCRRQRAKLPPGALMDDSEIGADMRIARLKSIRSSPQVQPYKKAVGCCPPGNPFGKVYKQGSACCADKVFDVSTHLCCTMNGRVLPLNAENIDYCHPLDGSRYCRMEDLELNSKRGMTANCQYNNKKKPIRCGFSCPEGSKPRDRITSAVCGADGLFQKLPECCQGCREDFQLNVIFLIQGIENINEDESNQLKRFLKRFLSHFKIAEENVRVGFRTIVPQDYKVYINSGDVQKAINMLTLEGQSRKVGTALRNLTAEKFQKFGDDRRGVRKMVISVLQEPPTDSIFESAARLKETAEVISVGVGTKISDDDLSVIATSARNTFRVAETSDLIHLTDELHDNVCGTNCL